MSRHQCQGLIARAAVVAALLGSRPTDAQVTTGPFRQPGGLYQDVITGVEYDRANLAAAEHRLPHLQDKLRRDSERGHAAAANRDARCIDNLRYRIAVDNWLIRQNSLRDPGYYPCRTDCISAEALAQAATPSPYPLPRQLGSSLFPPPPGAPGLAPPAPSITVTIVNAEPTGDTIAFFINGKSYQSAAGSRQELTLAPDATITFNGVGSIGPRTYTLSSGVYEFRPSAAGRELFKLPTQP